MWWTLILTGALAEPAAAPPASATPVVPLTVEDLPEVLRPWAGWVISKHPALDCPLIQGEPGCLWPGLLQLDVGPTGAAARLQVQADREIAVPLPGGRGLWPQGVTVDGEVAPVGDVDGRPMVGVSKGEHLIAWSYRWPSPPQALALPPATGQIALTVNGEVVAQPSVRDGALRLGGGTSDAESGDQLTLEVSRRITDGVPLQVSTRLTVAAAGAAREVELGVIGLDRTQPVALAADLPARLTEEGSLILQVRPGTFTVTLEALHQGPAAALQAPRLPAPWPEVEYWAVVTDDRVRAVNLSGPPGVDPARTPLPPEWLGLPTFRVSSGEELSFEELRRGEPEPAPNQLRLRRTLWLDADGRGLTAQDRFTGTLAQGWRLDVAPPALLGHVADHEVDQVITTREGLSGVETRATEVDLVAESRLDERPSALRAVGWQTPVTQLEAELHLPPGWRLLTATGVDEVVGTDPWSLFDLFFVLISALALGRLLGWRWGLVALIGLGLSRHEAGAPAWTFLGLAGAIGLGRALPEGRWRGALDAARWGLVLLLFSLLVPFGVQQLQVGAFPVLEHERYGSDALVLSEAPDRFVQVSTEYQDEGGSSLKGRKKSYLSVQQDPAAVVQTGPGVPSWQWNVVFLRWSGPVGPDHTMGLWLLGPPVLLALAMARVGLLLALALRLSGLREHPWIRGGQASAVVALLLLALPITSRAQDPALLTELEARLTAPPACLPHCATAPRATLRVVDDTLRVEVEVHALADSAWPLPGPTTAWVPAAVTLNGRSHAALARRPDGFLWARLPPGVHQLVASGPLPGTDALPLQLPDPPQYIAWSAEGWTVEGLKADGTTEGTVQLVRSTTRGGEAADADNLKPWLELTRRLDFGLPWRVETTVRRVGPTGTPIALKVPLLPGESVTDETFEVKDGALVVTLDRDATEVSWLATLAEASPLVLRAPTDVPWSEVWQMSCSPIHACRAADGPPPLAHVQNGAWSPLWRPWPGEAVTLEISRPEAVIGQTVTIDRAAFTWTPGRRLGQGRLELSIKSSQGGRQLVTLPPGAELQQVQVNDQDRPIRLGPDGVLALPLQPGSLRFVATWQQEHAPAWIDRVPAVDLGGPAVNTTVQVVAPPGRVVLALFGPRRGPVPLFWVYLALVALAAPLLGRLPSVPLRAGHWALLGLGLTQIPVFLPLVLVVTLLALGRRQAAPAERWWVFNLVQLGLVGLLLLSAFSLYVAIHAGLLLQPDLQVAGNGSTDQTLSWFVDRTPGVLATPTVVSAPLWTFRVAMLLWSLWLAASLVRWAPWVVGALGRGGWWRSPAPVPPGPSAGA